MTVITPESTATVYTDAHARIVTLVRHISDDQSRRTVPGTPEWTVHDLIAHLAAIPSDIAAGRLDRVPGPEQTEQQVEVRRDRTIPELLDEWADGIPPVVDAIRAGVIPAPIAIDVVTHEQDLRGALHAAHLDDDVALRFAVTGYTLGLTRRLKQAELPPLRLRDPARGFDATAGDGTAAATVAATEFELFRALAGRRSRSQVAAYSWTGDPTPYLDNFCVFGPLRETDIRD